jgi:RNA polymerase sigma factor (sigma-70 family)
MKKISDRDVYINKLVSLYQKDRDEKVFFKLLEEFELLFYAISWKYHSYCYETFKTFVDMLKSEFFLQILDYDFSKSCVFSGYICNKMYQIALNLGRSLNIDRVDRKGVLKCKGDRISQVVYSMVLDEAISKALSKRDCEILRLYYIQGHNQKQIAEELGLSQCSISYTIKMARKKLERFLSGTKELLDA